MKKIFLIFGLALLVQITHAQNVGLLNKQGLEDMLNKTGDTIYVINFWATWCSPCIEEIGFFQELHQAYEGKPVHVILINLDFPNQLKKRVIPFLKEKEITAEVLSMTELDYNAWIPIVEKDWSGAIPATLILRDEEKKFIPREISRKELFALVENISIN